MGRIARKAVAGIVLIALGSAASAQGIRMTIQQIWSGLEPFQSNPYYANIENNGPNTTGIISTDEFSSKTNIEYPVELPTGTKKRVLFTSASSYSDGKVVLRTPLGSKEATIKSSYNSEQSRFGLISDNPSDLIFLKSQSVNGPDQGNTAIGVGGCTPDDAPDRSFAYNCLDALVLGDGTERLRDEQVRAIKLFVQSGGSLVFVGGAAQSAANDVRWKDMLPIANSHVVNNRGLTELVGTVRPGSIRTAITKGTCYGRSYGAGIITIVSFNPFESPMRESEDRKAIMMKAVRQNHKQALQQLMNEQIGQSSGEYSAYSPSPSGMAPSYVSSSVKTKGFSTGFPMRDAATDPFEIKPPSLANIMWILIGYAIAVVPLNFVILRRLKKMELAWVTTPVISVIFSLFLLNSTIGLYKANATTRTSSVAVLADGNDEAIIYGKSEMFFPRAKTYDLELQDIESILSENMYDRSDSGGLNLKDDGRHVIAPDVHTANLAFKELSYVQTSNELKGLSMRLIRRDGQTYVSIANHSKAGVSNIMFVGTGLQETIPLEVPSGKVVQHAVGKFIRSKIDPKHPDAASGWQKIASSSPNKLVVLANVDTMHIGPNYGAGHPGSKYMVVSMPQWDPTVGDGGGTNGE